MKKLPQESVDPDGLCDLRPLLQGGASKWVTLADLKCITMSGEDRRRILFESLRRETARRQLEGTWVCGICTALLPPVCLCLSIKIANQVTMGQFRKRLDDMFESNRARMEAEGATAVRSATAVLALQKRFRAAAEEWLGGSDAWSSLLDQRTLPRGAPGGAVLGTFVPTSREDWVNRLHASWDEPYDADELALEDNAGDDEGSDVCCCQCGRFCCQCALGESTWRACPGVLVALVLINFCILLGLGYLACHGGFRSHPRSRAGSCAVSRGGSEAWIPEVSPFAIPPRAQSVVMPQNIPASDDDDDDDDDHDDGHDRDGAVVNGDEGGGAVVNAGRDGSGDEQTAAERRAPTIAGVVGRGLSDEALRHMETRLDLEFEALFEVQAEEATVAD